MIISKKLKILALIVASDVRRTIVKELNPEAKPWTKLKRDVEADLKREVSDGSFNWHLDKLLGVDVVKHPESWGLTKLGIDMAKVLNIVAKELA